MKLIDIFEAKKKEYRIYVDLDGVLVDFKKGVEPIIGVRYSEEKYANDKKFKKMFWDRIKEHNKQGGKLWLHLDLMHDAMKLWNYIKPHSPEILTATGTSILSAGEQKREWVSRHLGGNVVVHIVTYAKDKSMFAGPNHILIDDKPEAIKPWSDAGGTGIVHKSASNTIQQLKGLGV